MDYLKDSTIEELKKLYSEHHGFVFKTQHPIKDSSIEKLLQELKTHAITKENPVLVARLDAGICFVFEDFDGPKFFSYARMAEQIGMMGIAEIVPLYFFLKSN